MNEVFSLVDQDGSATEPIQRRRGRPPLSEAEKERRRQLLAAGHYVKNPAILKSKPSNRKNTAEENLRLVWQTNWEQASQEEKDRVELAQSEAVLLWKEINDCIKNMEAGTADSRAPFPDLTYGAGKEFMFKQGHGGSWPDVKFLACLSAENFESLTTDDLPLRNYGRLTTLPCVIWANFLAVALTYVKEHSDQFEEAFRLELESLVPNHLPTPAPPLPPGIRQFTKREEAATQAVKENVAIQQRLMVERCTE